MKKNQKTIFIVFALAGLLALAPPNAGAAPTIEGWTSNTIVPGSSLTLTKPTGVQVGDLLLILVGNDNATGTAQWNNTDLKPTGFTQIGRAHV